MTHLSAASNQEKQNRDYLDQYLQQRNIPTSLRRQIQQFFLFAGFDEDKNMLASLPVSLRLQLDLVVNRNLFLKVQPNALYSGHSRTVYSSSNPSVLAPMPVQSR